MDARPNRTCGGRRGTRATPAVAVANADGAREDRGGAYMCE